jgi:hypothetical protein
VFLSLSARQWTAVIACLLPLTVTLSEAYFYQNSYGELLGGTGGVSRYGLLTQIMGVMAILFVAIFALEKARTQVVAFLIIALSFATFIASWYGPVAKYGVLTYRDLSKQAADSSRRLGESMESAATTIRESKSPVLILIQNPLDYEFAYSFPLYLHSYADVKEVTLEFRVSPENLTDTSMRNLVLSLQEMTKRGSFESGWLVKKGEPSHVAGTYSCVALSPLKTEVPEWCRSLSVLQ